MTTIRQQRVSSLLREELDIMIGHELEDPRISMVTVTDVIVSRDLRNARVYVHHRDDEVAEQEILKGLQSASSYLRGQIAIRCGFRSTPELLFYYDDTPEKAQRIDELLRQIAEDRGPNSQSSEAANDEMASGELMNNDSTNSATSEMNARNGTPDG